MSLTTKSDTFSLVFIEELSLKKNMFYILFSVCPGLKKIKLLGNQRDMMTHLLQFFCIKNTQPLGKWPSEIVTTKCTLCLAYL